MNWRSTPWVSASTRLAGGSKFTLSASAWVTWFRWVARFLLLLLELQARADLAPQPLEVVDAWWALKNSALSSGRIRSRTSWISTA
jgi:hypothetical protein